MIEVIGLSGKAGSGKDFIYDQFLRPLGYHRWALADHFKITAVGRGTATYEEVYVTKPPHVRNALQQTGTEEGRDVYGEDIWCNTARAWMEHLGRTWGVAKFCITDIRFPNEVRFVQRLGGAVFRIIAPERVANNGMDPALAAHPSETSLDGYAAFDWFLYNNPRDADSIHTQVINGLKHIHSQQVQQVAA